MMSTYKIIDLSVGRSVCDASYSFDYQDSRFEVQRYGSHFSTEHLKNMLREHRHSVDAFSISDLPPVMRVESSTYVHREYLEIMSTPSTAPLCDGSVIKEIVSVNSLEMLISSGQIDPRQGIFIPIALFNLECVRFLREKYGSYLKFGDAYSVFSSPFPTKDSAASTFFTKAALHWANLKDLKSQTPQANTPWKRIARSALITQLHDVQYILSDPGVLSVFGADVVRNKEVILTFSHPYYRKELESYKPARIHELLPQTLKLSPFLNYSVLDATLRLKMKKETPLTIEEWTQVLSGHLKISPETRRYILKTKSSQQSRFAKSLVRRIQTQLQKPPEFAFIVHALSKDDLFRVPLLNKLQDLPNSWKSKLESTASLAPGFVYGRINHIISKHSGEEVSGVLFGLLSTPKMMKQENPEVTYRKIEALCYRAKNMGAKIVGLGAYTKVVGDSGATISRNSPLPVTTGNSLSASATLWAVADAVRKLNLVKQDSDTGMALATAGVIGATGSIGKVSAKLLAMITKKIILVAPRMEKLQELALEISHINPRCEVVITQNANEFASEYDILVTATSAFDQKIIDVETIKPGCVVCDCSRPLDFTMEDAMKRPDLLIIESGEVHLPGPVKMTCDLGLPDNSVYACLGETALLALEGKYESFTLGRDIDYQKVKEIYRYAQKHGVRLAAIRGHAGFISDREIQITRSLALERLKSWPKL